MLLYRTLSRSSPRVEEIPKKEERISKSLTGEDTHMREAYSSSQSCSHPARTQGEAAGPTFSQNFHSSSCNFLSTTLSLQAIISTVCLTINWQASAPIMAGGLREELISSLSPSWFLSAIFGFVLPLPYSKALLALALSPFILNVNSPLLGF